MSLDRLQVSGTTTVSWKSPSNIALVKYWGKHGDQLPANPSLSITLSEAHTITGITAHESQGNPGLTFSFEGQRNAAFEKRIARYVARFREKYPALASLDLEISSSNSFPHSAGIASSASAMSALALCLMSLANESGSSEFMQDASDMSRQGSGSACRSVYGPVAAWGASNALDGSSDRYAIQVANVDNIFSTYKDAICIVDTAPKPVSSSQGHALMHGHPFAQQRFAQANDNFRSVLGAMAAGDLERFVEIIETEALSLHAMMMTSSPSYLLIKPESVEMIGQIRKYRDSAGIPLCFTLDAGPNIHVLYPSEFSDRVDPWLKETMARVAPQGRILFDHAGNGPEKLT